MNVIFSIKVISYGRTVLYFITRTVAWITYGGTLLAEFDHDHPYLFEFGNEELTRHFVS